MNVGMLAAMTYEDEIIQGLPSFLSFLPEEEGTLRLHLSLPLG